MGKRIFILLLILLMLAGGIIGLVSPDRIATLFGKEKPGGTTPSGKPAQAAKTDLPPGAVGYINLNIVFNQSDYGKTQIAVYNKSFATKNGQLKQLAQQVGQMKARLQAALQHGDRKTVAQGLPAFQAAEKRLNAMQTQYTGELKQAQTSLDQKFRQRLNPVLDSLRTRHRLSAIEAYDPGHTLSLDPSADLTREAIGKLNAAPAR